MLDFYVKTGIRFSLRDKRLFEITEVEITRVDCISILESPVLQIRRGNWDNLELSIFLHKNIFYGHHYNVLVERVLMRGHYICFVEK